MPSLKQMIKTGHDDIPNLKGLVDAITKKQSEAEFLDDLKKALQVYVQDVYQLHSTHSISDSDAKINPSDEISNLHGLESSINKKETLVVRGCF